MTCGYQTWLKGGLWLGVTCLITKSRTPRTMRLREVMWQLNFIIYLFYEAYWHLTWLGDGLWNLNLDDGLTNIWLFVFWPNFYSIEKVPSVKILSKALSFLNQFHQFPEKYLCGSSCFKNSSSQLGKKFLIRATIKFSIRNLNNDLQNISNWK